jgi:hypothetical protein
MKIIKGLPGQKNENPFQIGGPEGGTPKRYFLKSSHEGGCHISYEGMKYDENCKK